MNRDTSQQSNISSYFLLFVQQLPILRLIIMMRTRHQPKQLLLTILLLSSSIEITANNPNYYSQQLTALTGKHKGNVVKLQIQMGQSYFPAPIRGVMSSYQAQVDIKYGPYFHSFTAPSAAQQSQQLSLNHNTVFTTVQTQQKFNNDGSIDEQLAQILKSTFAVSISSRYTLYRQNKEKARKHTYSVNDPNDKFCRNHIQQIITNILPCANYAGIMQLLDLDNMFATASSQTLSKLHYDNSYQNNKTSKSKMIGMHIRWSSVMLTQNIRSDKIKISLFLYATSKSAPIGDTIKNESYSPTNTNSNIDGIIKGMRLNNKCMQDSQYSYLKMTDALGQSIGIKDIVALRLQQSFIAWGSTISDNQSQIQRDNKFEQHRTRLHSMAESIQFSQIIMGNWYNKRKRLQLLATINTNLPNNTIIRMTHLLPLRAGIYEIELQDISEQSSNKKIVQLAHSSCLKENKNKERRYKQAYLVCETHVKIVSQQINQELTHNINKSVNEIVKFRLSYSLDTKMVSFDVQQAIFGGGIEITSIPIRLYIQNKQTQTNNHSQNNEYSQWLVKQDGEVNTSPLNLRTLEPDEAFPFQFITIIFGIFGYLWLAVWRKISADITNFKANIKQVYQNLSTQNTAQTQQILTDQQ